MSIKDKYTVKSIDSFQCSEWLLYKHYAKRIPSISYSFGLFQDKQLVGVLTIGKPASPSLCDGICGVEYTEFVFELNRLCINEGLEKNVLSFFVSKSLKMIKDNLILVSYADTEWGHFGFIYQATNFIYTGLSAKRTDLKVKGFKKMHGRTMSHLWEGKEGGSKTIYDKYGDDAYLEERSRKHRYVIFLGKRKNEFKSKLNYPIEPYPKGDSKRYDASYKPITQQQLF